MNADTPPGSGTATYGEFLKELIAAQEQRKTSFETRGLAVITTSGTLVTLLFALAALSTKKQATFELPSRAQDWLIKALPFFFAAALAALGTNVPLTYQAAKPNDIKPLVEQATTEAEAAKDVALARIAELKSAKKMNGIKGWLLLVAMALEVAAVGCVAIAVSFII